ncbi:MAG: hypothetical protein ACRDP6_32755 [Actinoallomurus sp.]
MRLNPNPAPLAAASTVIKADAYRTTHLTPAEPPPVPGRHLVQPGETFTYWGLDRTLWGQQVVVTGLCPLDYRCRIEIAPGCTLTQVDEHGLWGGLR